MKSCPLNIGIIGVGRFGSRHLEKWQRIAHANLIGFHDIDPAVRTRVEGDTNVPFVEQNELIRRADVLDIVVPADAHFRVAKKALLAGKHVFIEKPFSETAAEAIELASLAAASGRRIGIGHIERFNPVYRALKNIAAAQPLTSIRAYRQGPFIPGVGVSVSIILELMIHDIDLALQLIPSPLEHVEAEGEIIHTQKIDRAEATLHFENGARANLFASRAEATRRREMICCAGKNEFRANFMEGRLEGPGPGMPMTFGTYDAMAEELQAFIDSIEGAFPHEVNENDGLVSVRIAERIEKLILQRSD